MRYYHTRELPHIRNELKAISTLQLLHAIKRDLARQMKHKNIKNEYDRILGAFAEKQSTTTSYTCIEKRRSEVLEICSNKI